MAMFDALDINAKHAFFEFGAQAAYYDALELYFKEMIAEDVANTEIVKAILNVQVYWVVCKIPKNG